MLKHPDIWRAIDELAAQHGFSPSGLAREAGLDATTFNLSKRTTSDGKKRWPSTESIAKILDVTGATFTEFSALTEKTNFKNKIMVLPLAAAAKAGHFDADGTPLGKAWAKRTIPGTDDADAFGISVNARLTDPGYRLGALLIASPAKKLQKGDRAAVVTADGILSLREVVKVNGKQLEFAPSLVSGAKSSKLVASLGQLRLVAKITTVLEA